MPPPSGDTEVVIAPSPVANIPTEATVHHTDIIVSVCIKEAVSCQWLTHPGRNELQWAAVLNGVSAELLPSKTGKLLCALDLHGR